MNATHVELTVKNFAAVERNLFGSLAVKEDLAIVERELVEESKVVVADASSPRLHRGNDGSEPPASPGVDTSPGRRRRSVSEDDDSESS